MIWLLLLFCIPGGFSQVEGGKFKYQSMFPCNSSVLQGTNANVTYQKESLNKQNQYNISISFPDDTVRLTLVFDSEASLVLLQPNAKEIQVAFAKLDVPRKDFDFLVPGGSSLHIQVSPLSSPPDSTVPCITNVIVDPVDLCENPKTGNFDKCIYITEGQNQEISSRQKKIDKTCGRRKVLHTELTVNGQPTNVGDWPWHVALFSIATWSSEYFCGGTLLSKTVVLTAANCAFSKGNPVDTDSIIVYLGKHHRIRGDLTVQEREVFDIIIHPEFNVINLDNDIALLRLKSEAVFTDYVQPACLWPPDNKIPNKDLFGTVVGWGLNGQEEPSSYLQRITIPIVPELSCLKSNPTFFQKKLNTNKFCAGYANGTSACDDDKGGGFMILVPDTPGDASQASGSWYVRGIVSLASVKYNKTICDPNQYTIFTDVEKYQDWLSGYLN